jgi:phenylalanyl-tRNA synthetase alpha chain
MLEKIELILNDAIKDVEGTQKADLLRELEIKYLGKKGVITALLKSMGKVPPQERKNIGRAVNDAKKAVASAIVARRSAIEENALALLLAEDNFDISLPSKSLPMKNGTVHPVTIIQEHVEKAFEKMGFKVLDYFESENDWYNFEGLNIPGDHPARDMQDTFWLEDGNLLRTHTSPGQLHAMKEFKAPFRAIFPGRVFRYERTDASHEHTFHQVEGLMIEKNLNVSHLIGMMKLLLEAIFERDMNVRLRPGFFPFVEPGFELDIECTNCGGKGCAVCKQSGWIELLPCGMVHPNVLRAGGVDPDKWVGWAFGLGLSRLAMMKYKISHITHFMAGDLRFLKQFEGGGVR